MNRIAETGTRLKLVRKPATDEWVVKVYVNGKYDDDKSYYTDDKQDAIDTMAQMKKEMGITASSDRMAIARELLAVARDIVAATPREELLKMIQDAPKASIKIDDRVHVAVGADAIKKVEEKARLALNRGATVTWQDGRTEWITTEPVLDRTKHDSEAYTWDQSGDKVLCEFFLHTKVGAHVTKKLTGKRFLSYNRLYE